MSAGRVVLIVLGSIGALLGLALLVGGGVLLWSDRTQREDGYVTTSTERFATSTYAHTRTWRTSTSTRSASSTVRSREARRRRRRLRKTSGRSPPPVWERRR